MKSVHLTVQFTVAERIMFRRLVERLNMAYVRGHDVRLNEWEVEGVRSVLEAMELDRQ